MSTNDDEFFKRLRATFSIEAEEHLSAISARLLDLEKTGAGSDSQAHALEEIHRAAHSLKGASRAVDLREVEAVCQGLESVFSNLKRAGSSPSAENFDVLHGAVDLMRVLIAPGSAFTPELIAQRDALLLALKGMQLESAALQGNGGAEPKAPTQPIYTPAPPAPPPVSAPSSKPPAPSPPRATGQDESAQNETVRIGSAKLERQLLEIEELLPLKAMLAQYAQDLRELNTTLALWRKGWASISGETRWLREAPLLQGVAPAARIADFLDFNQDTLRGLDTRLRALDTSINRDRQSTGKMVDTLLDHSKQLLMLPFTVLTDIFPRIMRDLCRDQHKEAELAVRGAEIEIDKRILDGMKDPFIHILRNCVDHGLEPPSERVSQGKAPCGSILIAVSQIEGNKVEIVVCDDGRGVDPKRVRQAALRRGVISVADQEALSHAETLDLIFRSGVSTSSMITDISGLGLGMSIVRAQTEKLGGNVSLESTLGSGTRLRIVLPVALATFRGLLVRVGEGMYVIPRGNVERVLRFRAEDVVTVQNRETLALNGRAIALVRMDSVLGDLSPRPQIDRVHLEAVVIMVGEARVAFIVDQVLHEEDVLVKPLRRPIVRARHIAGATVIGTGRAVPVLNVEDLLKSATRAGIAGSAVGQASGASTASQHPVRRVLVVEDSITSRMLLKGILESAGHEVRTAVDGVEGFTALREEEFDLVVSDVEMPRMNGFELTGRIRADRRLAELPVILVTALEKREERERGIDAGANAYVLKSNFDQSNLLEIVSRLV